MNMQERMAAARAKAAEQKAKALAVAKPKPRVKWSWTLSRWVMIGPAMVLSPVKPASNVRKLLPKEPGTHTVGGKCPHCRGTGAYKWHLQDRSEKCYRCHGKGRLNARDMKYLTNRQMENRAICDVASA